MTDNTEFGKIAQGLRAGRELPSDLTQRDLMVLLLALAERAGVEVPADEVSETSDDAVQEARALFEYLSEFIGG